MKEKGILSILFVILLVSSAFSIPMTIQKADAAGIPKRAISTSGTWVKSDLPTTTVYTDKDNDFGPNRLAKFGNASLIIRNPASTFGYTLTGAAIAANRTLNLPLTTATDTLATLGLGQTFTGANTFSGSNTFSASNKFSGTTNMTGRSNHEGNAVFNSNSLIIRNPAVTFGYTLTGAAIAANRTLNLPLTTATDTLVSNDVAATLTSKTLTTPQINGLDLAITSQSASYTATSTDDIILMDASGATRILTLPAAASNTGKIFFIKSIGTPGVNVVMVDGNGAETIDGFANFNLTMSDQVAKIQSDGTNWISLDNVAPKTLVAGTTINRWHGTAITSLASTIIASTGTTLRAYPFVVESSITIDQIKTEVSAAASPTTNLCRMGIYRDNGNVYPGSLVSGSDVATFDGTAAVKTNTFASPIKLTKGLYWLAYTCQTAATTQPTFRGVPVGAIPTVLGYTSTMGISQAGTGWTVAFTFAAMPTTYPSGGTVLVNTIAPMILVRITG